MEDFFKAHFRYKKKKVIIPIIFWYLVFSLFFNQDIVVHSKNKIQFSQKIVIMFVIPCLRTHASSLHWYHFVDVNTSVE